MTGEMREERGKPKLREGTAVAYEEVWGKTGIKEEGGVGAIKRDN